MNDERNGIKCFAQKWPGVVSKMGIKKKKERIATWVWVIKPKPAWANPTKSEIWMGLITRVCVGLGWVGLGMGFETHMEFGLGLSVGVGLNGFKDKIYPYGSTTDH